MREHVVQVFCVAVLDDGPRGFDDRHSHPGVLMSDGLHERFDQTLSLHVKVFWRKSGKSVPQTFYFSYLLDGWYIRSKSESLFVVLLVLRHQTSE